MKNIEKIYEVLVNKELEPYNVDYSHLMENKENQIVEGKPWYEYYTFKNDEEYKQWEDFCINYIKENLKISKKEAEKEFSWFSLGYSLKIEKQ